MHANIMQTQSTHKALFLDRDGVINEEKKGSYIFNIDEFIFMPKVLEALQLAANHFDYIIIVTNQRGVGRGYMTEEDLDKIHSYLINKVTANGGRIEKIYFAPNIESDHPDRKPNIGMGLKAANDFPNIDFTQSVMVGNNMSDMQFGKRLGMQTVFLHTTQAPISLPHELVDCQFPGLYEWTQTLQ